MIGGLFPENRLTLSSEKISDFYLPNKDEFDKSIGLDFTNRLPLRRSYNDEIVILAQFCELVGPMPLIVVPRNTQMCQRTIDMVVLKAMSADYQCCEDGDILFSGSTNILDADCAVPFFTHYFTLVDVYGRGYVRPCCLIVCCADRVRATQLFDKGCECIGEVLEPFMKRNVGHFYRELKSNLSIISSRLGPDSDSSFTDATTLTLKDLNHLSDEYASLLKKIEEEVDDIECEELLDANDEELFFSSFQGNSLRREPRSIYIIMESHENEMLNAIHSIAEQLKKTSTPRMFSLHERTEFDLEETLDPCTAVSSLSTFNFRYFLSAVNCDRIVHVISKLSPICCCRKSVDDHCRMSNTSQLDKGYLFPSLISFRGSQCQYVRNICQQSTNAIVAKLIGCIFQQLHLVVLVNSKQNPHLMMLLCLFLPKESSTKYISSRNDWPTLEQINETPVSLVNNETCSATFPTNLKRYLAVYDSTTNRYRCGPEYNKGHIKIFLELFKTLNYNECHLETIVSILLLGYFDLVYQWISLLGRRDRRWISKYIIETGASLEDTLISERLALLVLQRMAVAHHVEHGSKCNLFLTTPGIFSWQIPARPKDK